MFDLFSLDFVILAVIACVLLKPEDFVVIMGKVGSFIKQMRTYFEVDRPAVIIERSKTSPWVFPHHDNCRSPFARPL